MGSSWFKTCTAYSSRQYLLEKNGVIKPLIDYSVFDLLGIRGDYFTISFAVRIMFSRTA